MPDILPNQSALIARLPPDQQQTLLAILKNTSDPESFQRELEKHPELVAALQWAPASGRFDDPTDLESVIERLSQPAGNLTEMPRRIELCRQALSLVDRDENPHLWGILRNELSISLAQNPQGARADNLEQAIAHAEQALGVYTRQAYPEEWAHDPEQPGGRLWWSHS